MFRRNDEYGDSAAQKLHKFWSDGVVGVLHYNLVFTNISTCEPEKFKVRRYTTFLKPRSSSYLKINFILQALACLLAVKPCSHHIPQKQVCRYNYQEIKYCVRCVIPDNALLLKWLLFFFRSDCEFLLGKCLDMKATSIGVSISKVCAAILPNANQTECLSVSDYITKPPKVAKTTRGQGQLLLIFNRWLTSVLSSIHSSLKYSFLVTLPCKDSPCKSDEVCMVSNSCDKRFDPTCEDYICVKGN